MKILIDGIVYDSTETPVLVHFDQNEARFFEMKKFVSAPESMTEEERSELIRKDLITQSNAQLSKGITFL